ncbi:hypothetical protein BsWGS_07793 [Bradybaena similaris]
MQYFHSVHAQTSYRHLTAMTKALSAVDRLHVQCHPLSAITLARRSSKQAGPKPLKAVIFDMGGVILPGPFKLFEEFESRAGLPLGTVSRLIASQGMDSHWAQMEIGKFTVSQFTQIFSKELSEHVGKNVDVSPLMAKISHGTGAAIPAMIDAIKCIRAEGLKTALLTNNWFTDDQRAHTAMPLDRSLFDVVVESCVLGIRKPDKRIYTRCLQELMVGADEAVFLDDIGSNLKAAQELGIRTIKVHSPDQGVAELEQILGTELKGFVPGTTSVPKHLQLDSNSLENYLKSLGLHDKAPPAVRMFEHGQSNPTYYVSYAGRNMVLRKKPPGKLLPSAHAVDREFRVMSAMQQAGVPVPNMVAFCNDERVIGTPFYLMDYVTGRILKDMRLPEVAKASRRDVIMAMVSALAQIHAVDIDKAGLGDYGKKGNYCERNFRRWASQYEHSKTREIPSMTKLMEWLPKHMPQNERITVIHGDFRLDNLMLHPEQLKVIAVLDWELSTLGDPITDLATSVLAYYLPLTCPLMVGLAEQDVSSIGIPTVEEIKAEYCRLSNLTHIDNWDFYMSFVLFRTAAILQGVYKRNISGQGSSSIGKSVGEFAEAMADIGWGVASKSSMKSTAGISVSPTSCSDGRNKRHYSTLTTRHQQTVMSPVARAMSSGAIPESQAGKMAVSVEGLSPRVQDLHKRVRAFIQEHVVPLELLHRQRLHAGSNRWEILPEVEEAKAKAKAAGLWNLFLPLESDPGQKYGAGLTSLEYAFLCEEMGKYRFAPEVFNCNAPDTGNMETIVRYGSEEQKKQWLLPLLDGKIRSCFAMTEPAVASSDATNITSSIRREGNHYIVNGHKWWTSGALDPRCKICIFMGKTDTGAVTHKQQSMILIPMDTPGIKVVRPLTVFGYDDAPEGHGEVIFEDVKVPVSNVLLGEGRGFEIAQGRLGPGRIHHCMRLIGAAERALELMVNRTVNRTAFGKPLAAQGSIQQDVAKSRIEIEQCRLLVLKAAYKMDLYGNKVAAPEIAMIKVATPNMALAVIDRAIQAHGGAGVNDDLPLAHLFASARTLRIADGPDEVHMRAVARMEYAKTTKAKL